MIASITVGIRLPPGVHLPLDRYLSAREVEMNTDGWWSFCCRKGCGDEGRLLDLLDPLVAAGIPFYGFWDEDPEDLGQGQGPEAGRFAYHPTADGVAMAAASPADDRDLIVHVEGASKGHLILNETERMLAFEVLDREAAARETLDRQWKDYLRTKDLNDHLDAARAKQLFDSEDDPNAARNDPQRAELDGLLVCLYHSEIDGKLVIDVDSGDLDPKHQWGNGVPKVRLMLNEDIEDLDENGQWSPPRRDLPQVGGIDAD